MSYFSKFPVITYNNQQTQNITVRCRIRDNVKRDQSTFFPYTLQYNERPESVAFDYYSSTDYYWLVNVTNNVIDYYHDWYQEDSVFYKNIEFKYGSLSNASQNVKFYSLQDTGAYNDIFVSPDTIEYGSVVGLTTDITDTSPVTYLDYEQRENDKKQQIQLVNRALANDLSTELENLLNDRN